MANSGANLIVGGTFTSLGGVPRNYLAMYDTNNPIPTLMPWNPNPNGFVSDVRLANGNLYISGNYSSIGGALRPGLAHLELATGNATSWTPPAVVAARPPAVSNFNGSMFYHYGKQLYIYGRHYVGDDGFTRDLIGINTQTGGLRP